MPLLSARDFPGINSVPDNSGLANGIFTAFQGIARHKEKAELAQKEETARQLDIVASQALQLRNMPDGGDDPKERMMANTRKRKALTSLMMERHAQGLDNSLFDEAFDEKDPDMFNTKLMNVVMQSGKGRDMLLEQGLKPQERFTDILDDEGVIVGQESSLTGQDIASPRTPKDVKPLTDIGKARADLKAGRITQKEFNDIKSSPQKFQSSVGKLIADKKLAVEMFGADSPQAKAIQDAITSEQAGEDVKLTDVAGLRKEFTKQSGEFIKMRDAFNKIQSASDTGPGDVSLIFSFMKIIDPGSTVREGEFATAEQTAGIPEQVVNLYNKALTGDRLGPEQRASFKAEAGNLFATQLNSQQQLEASFGGLATRAKMNPLDVAIDFVGDLRGYQPSEVPQITPTTPSVQEGSTATNPSTGEKIIFKDGKWQPQ